MRFKVISLLLCIVLLFSFSGCFSEYITIPYSSDEYVAMNWSIDELKKHFLELGFETIEVAGNTEKVTDVLVQNDELLYESFDSGDSFPSYRKVCLWTEYEAVTYVSVDNSSEFKFFVDNGIESSDNYDMWQSFLEENHMNFIEFDGTITDWYDDVFWISVAFSISIEDSDVMSYSESNIEISDMNMDYSFNEYHSGLVKEGMKVHVIAEIVQIEDRWELEPVSIDILS